MLEGIDDAVSIMRARNDRAGNGLWVRQVSVVVKPQRGVTKVEYDVDCAVREKPLVGALRHALTIPERLDESRQRVAGGVRKVDH